MLPYIALLSLPSFAAIIGARRLPGFFLIFAFVIYVIFVGFRDEVGPDWFTYQLLHLQMKYIDFQSLFQRSEPFSFALFYVSELSGNHVYLTNIVAAVLLLYGVFSFARRTVDPWIAILAATPYLIVVFGMSGIRQAMGIGMILLVVANWTNWGLVRKFAVISIGALFHTSAIIGVFLVIAGLKWRLSYRIILGIPILLVVFYLSTSFAVINQNLEIYQQRYIGDEQITSFGSLFHIGLILFPAIVFVIFHRRMKPFIPYYDLMWLGVLSAVIVFFFNFVSSTGASRLSLYLYFLPMMAFPALTLSFGQSTANLIRYLVVFYHFLTLVLWFKFANTSGPYIPYKNLLFDFGV